MSRGVLFLIILIVPYFLLSQTFSWATSDTSFYSSRGSGLALDHSGALISVQLNSPGTSIIKFDTSRQILWRQDIQGYMMWLPKICVDNMDNIYLTGTAGSDLVINGVTYQANGMFLIKYNSQGVFQWFTRSYGIVTSRGVTSDGTNVYVGGSFNGNAHFDTIHLNSPVLFSYVAKYDPSGQVKWVNYVSQDHSTLSGIKTDSRGNSYVTGEFIRIVKFDTISLTIYNLMGGQKDIYLAKIDSLGKWKWAVHAGGNSQDQGMRVAIDSEEKAIYVSGFIGSPTATFGTYTATNTGGVDFAIAKYDTNGVNLWATIGGGPGQQLSEELCVTPGGQTFLATSTKFINKFDSAGNYVWWQHQPAYNDGMLPDNKGGIYITGYFNDSIQFGNYTLQSKNSANRMFIAYMSDAFSLDVPSADQVEEGLKVFPNPTNTSLTLLLEGYKHQGSHLVRIRNCLGQEVLNLSCSFNSQGGVPINTEALAPGVYFIDVVLTERVLTRKIIIQ